MTGVCKCGFPLGPKNKTGLCRRCGAIVFNTRPERSAQLSKAIRDRYATDPAYREQISAHLKRTVRRPDVIAKKSAAARKSRFWEKTAPLMAAGSPARQKAGRALSETRMAWCPPHLRDEARHLTRSKKLGLAETQRIIAEQVAAETRRFRKSIGAK